MRTARDVVAAVHNVATPIGVPSVFWGICQGAPSGSAGSKVISVKVNGASSALPMAYDSAYNAGVAPATNDVVWGLVVGSDYLVIGKRA